MKKNVMMRFASLLLVMVLLTSSVISGTFAKYVTKDEAVDHARVAKWGVTVEATDDSMFNGYYETHDAVREAKIGAVSVLSADTDDVVAPGTNGKLADFVIKGTPEVAVRVNYEVTNLELAGWALSDATPYCPIIFTINGTDYYIGDTESVDDFETRIKNAIKAYERDYAPGTNLADAAWNELQVSWRWEFEGGSWAYQTDDKDTYLGNQASIGNAPLIDITIVATATQID